MCDNILILFFYFRSATVVNKEEDQQRRLPPQRRPPQLPRSKLLLFFDCVIKENCQSVALFKLMEFEVWNVKLMIWNWWWNVIVLKNYLWNIENNFSEVMENLSQITRVVVANGEKKSNLSNAFAFPLK